MKQVSRPIAQLDVKTGKRLAVYPGVQDAAVAVDGNGSAIYQAAKGGRHSAYGFKWKYMPAPKRKCSQCGGPQILSECKRCQSEYQKAYRERHRKPTGRRSTFNIHGMNSTPSLKSCMQRVEVLGQLNDARIRARAGRDSNELARIASKYDELGMHATAAQIRNEL